MKKILLLAVPAAILAACCSNPEKDLEKRIEDTLSKMTLEEKVKIIHAQSKFSSAGVPRIGIPELWTDDGPHGVRPETLWDQWRAADWTNDSVTAYPALTCLAASWNKEIARRYGRSVGEEARYRKKNVLLGPGVNIYRSPLGGRNFEYMGEDPFLAGHMAANYIQGLQSNGVAACVKHFVLNDTEHKRHKTNVIVDDRALYEIYLEPFRIAVPEGGSWSKMASYNPYGNQPACHNKRLLCDVLKGEWGFDGAVISDWGGCHDTDEAAANGLDLEFGTHTNGVDQNTANAYDSYYLALPYLEKLRKGELSEDDLNDKCRRVLRLMFRTEQGGSRGHGRMNCPEHSADARRIATEGIVLLKNEGALLPLRGDAKKIVVMGENAIKPMAVGGSSSSLKARYEVTVLDGIRAAMPQTEVVYERAYVGRPIMNKYHYNDYDISDPRDSVALLADALKAAQDADYVIFVGGLNKHKKQDCEGADRESFGLPYGQDAAVEALAALRNDIIFVNVSGNAVAMPWIDKVGAVVQAWYSASEAGNAIADILTGAVCPSGKLPFTMPVLMEDGPVTTEQQYPGIKRENEEIWDQEYSEGIYVGYRWYEARNVKPLFPFGYGLSYTTFEYGDIKLSSKTMGDKLTISVPVTNTGSVAGAEVVELYITDCEASVDRPVKELKGFEKLYLEPGETKTARMEIDRRALSWFDAEKHEWVAEKGEFKALVGASSADIRCEATFKLK
ncbi:MAG: glycoside hydrolase family 3 C-terminal domain-containing protein [Bacteroidales bacterium]|nr:glycoside hydrolase family 3 C-terminal domain-containing protein [Bacteroidales bacterium]